MTLIIPPGFLHSVIEFACTGDPEPMVTTCGHEIDTASGANNDDAADDLMSAFALAFRANLSSAYSITGCTVYIGNDGPTIIGTSTAAPVAGQVGVNPYPPNTAFLLRKRTDLAGRRGRGRMYIPGVVEATATANGLLTTVETAQWQTLADDYMDRLTTAVGARLYPPVVLHRSEGIGVEPPPTPILSFVAEQRLATQRRRLRP
jgi:hypothetical protein